MTLKKYYATPPNYRLISFSFRAWIGLIWEISARAARQNAWNFGARLFWNDTTLSEFKDIRYIKVFLDAASEKCSCPSTYIMHIHMHMYMYMHYAHTWTRTFSNISRIQGTQNGLRSSISRIQGSWNGLRSSISRILGRWNGLRSSISRIQGP